MKKSNVEMTIFFIVIVFVMPASVYIQWQRNKEMDIAGYKIYWGTKSKRYNGLKKVGMDTSALITHLRPGDYYFAVTAYDTIGNESDYSAEARITIESSDTFSLASDESESYNFPNPFNPIKQATILRYYLSAEQFVSIDIYDTNENLVRNLLPPTLKTPGEHTEDWWDGKSNLGFYVANGIYYAVISCGWGKKVITVAVVQ